MRRAITRPRKKHTARKPYIDQPVPTARRHPPIAKTGAGTPGSPFSPPVKSDSGEFSRKKNTCAMATVIIAK